MAESNREEQSYTELVNSYLARFYEKVNAELPEGKKLPKRLLDESGFAAIRRGSATVGINVLEDKGILLFLSAVMPVPEKRQLELFRKLLEYNFLATSDAAFAIDRRTNKIYLRALRGLKGLDYEEFEDLLETVAAVADEFDDKLREEFGS